MDVKFEYLGEGPNGSKRWKIEAISVTTTRNNRKYPENEMMLGARSLSFRPLDRNHDMSRILPFPANQTEVMDYNPQTKKVEGTMLIAESEVNELIRTGKINKLSIEQIPTKGEACSMVTNVCEQKGVVFTGLALLDYDVMPGDPNTSIKTESLVEIPISEMLACVKGCKCEVCKQEADDDEDWNDYSNMNDCISQNSDLSDPKKYCTMLKQEYKIFKSTDWPKIEKDAKLSIEDIANTWNSMNLSQRAHIIDPNSMYPNTNKFVKKTFDKMSDEQQKALIKTYGFRHSYNDVKHLLGKDDQEPPSDMIVDNKLLAEAWEIEEKDLISDFWKLVKAGIKDPRAWSMSMQNPNNKTEKSSLNSESQTNSIMSSTPTIKATRWKKEEIDALVQKILAKKEINSMVSAFIGQQNNKAPLSDGLADRLYNASDDDLDTMARVTSDQNPSVIPAGGLADYKAFTQEMENILTKVTGSFTKTVDEINQKWIDATKPKTEAFPSSQVSDPQFQAKQEMTKAMYEYFDVKGHTELKDKRDFSYTLNMAEYLQKYSGYQPSGAGAISPTGLVQKDIKGETVTVTAGDMGQIFAKQVMLLPGGRMRVPVRQYVNFTEIPNGADRANWYTIGSFVFTTVTEGTEPTNVAQTVTKVQALPTLRGAVQRIGYTQIENAPFGLVDAVNNAMVLAGLHDEALDLLGSGGSYWGTASNVTNWVNGNTGANIVSQNDDIASMTVTRTGLIAAKRLIAAGGYDTSPGNLVLFCHPKTYQDLMLDTNLNTYYQYARPDITATYVLEQLYGVDIVPTTAVAAQANTTNATYRNVLAVKGWALGIAAAREITIEVQRRNEVQQLIVSGMHRVKSAVIDYAASCGISGAQ